jgi:hypothetical protein
VIVFGLGKDFSANPTFAQPLSLLKNFQDTSLASDSVRNPACRQAGGRLIGKIFPKQQ